MNKKSLAIIILAAGKGTRMKSKLPKILHSICGKPMVKHVLDLAFLLDPKRTITVLGLGMEDVASVISETSEVVVQTEQLGTADAVKPALEKLKGFNGNVLILYADTPLITYFTLERLLKNLEENDLSILGFQPHDPSGYGRLVTDENDRLKRIVECNDATDEEKEISLCNSGVIACNYNLLDELVAKVANKNSKNEYYLTDIIEIAVKSGKSCGYVEGDEQEVLGVNNRAQLSDAIHVFQQRLRHKAMLDGVTLLDPETVYLNFDTTIGKDVTIHQNVVFGPNVEIADDVEIRSFSHIEGAKIDSGAIIGPFARIRPGSEIQSDARVGNFVEIKNSVIKKGAKVGHLSYIGDAKIGSEANIGAGTVTCNYDGFNKYKTEIGDKAFIGSNSALVAPVKIGDKAFVAAGSTITKDVADKALAVARNRQFTKENWADSYLKRKKK